MKITRILLIGLLAFPMVSLAAPLEISAGVSVWRQEFDGDISYGTPIDKVDLSRDLGFDDENKVMAYFSLKHFIPIVPNIRVMHSQIEGGGNSIIDRNINFGGQLYPVNRSVVTDLDLTHTDLTLFYSPIDSFIELDLGLTVRFLDGTVSLLSPESAPGLGDEVYEKQNFSAPIPMLYGRLEFEIPSTNFYIETEANLIAYSGNRLLDFRVGAGYMTDFNLGLELGYRRLNLVLDDIDDVDTDLNISGIYGGITLRF
jgi:outer membrane protein